MVDILFLAHGRVEFTAESLLALMRNTNPHLVRRLLIFTDGETPSYPVEAAEGEHVYWRKEPGRSDLQHAGRLTVTVVRERIGGPVAIMQHYLDSTASDPAPYFAKIDNDLIVCPGWLEACMDVMIRNSQLDLLGIEPWCPELDFLTAENATAETYGVRHGRPIRAVHPYKHVGGIGLFRRSAFEGRARLQPLERAVSGGARISFGWTDWQWAHPEVTKAFLNPPLPVFLLDHLPFEPWLSLSRGYVAEGVQRQPWAQYPAELHNLWDWWTTAG